MPRLFEKISETQAMKENIVDCYHNVKLPERKTKMSCGYDFYAPYDFTIPANGIVLMATGIKVQMYMDEVLKIHPRSSWALKGIVLANQVGIIDADYYNNPENEGHIIIPLKNVTDSSFKVEKGARVAQGIFHSYAITTSDTRLQEERFGGFGSTKD